MPQSLDIQDYLDATADAARRTRNASITVVIASVIVFSGLLNSLQNSWMLQRIHTSNSMRSEYVLGKIGKVPPIETPDNAEFRAFENRYREFYASLMRTYVDSSYVIRVPFFGFKVDANDLGVLGGIAFVIILVMLRFCISREVDNLKISFLEAKSLGQLREFYTLLAMRQVFTIPDSGSINRTPFLVWIPKLFCFVPLVVHIAVMAHDFTTVGVGTALSDVHTAILFSCEVLLTFTLIVLTAMVVTRMRRVDRLWDQYWCEITQMNSQGQSSPSRPIGS